MKKVILASGLALSLATAGCVQTTAGTGIGGGEAIGTVGGAVAGGLLGSTIGSGEGRAVATAVGIVAGGLIGNRIGASLDEQARQRAIAAEYRALEYGRAGTPVAWRDPDGAYGQVVPGPAYQTRGLDCRDFTHTIYIDGQPQVARGTACRQADGTWAPVA
jgi:surface antigen